MLDTKDRIFEEIQKVVNNHPAIILGSGSSISYGIASMGELSEILKDYFNHNPYSDEDSKKCIKNFIRNLDSGKGLEDALLDVKATKEVECDIVKIVWKHIQPQNQKVYKIIQEGQLINLEKLFSYMIYNNPQTSINIVSTNYDMIAEYAASQTKALINTRFTQSLMGRFISTTLKIPRNMKNDDYIGYINIYKVHGSLDWFHKQDNDMTVCFPNSTEIPEGYEPCIITPGTNKYEKTQYDPYRTLLSDIDHLFARASGFLCIGYGFNDQHVQPKLLSNARERNTTILIVTKDITTSIKQEIIEKCDHYIIISSYKKKGTKIQTKKDSFILEDEIYWTIEGLMKIIK